jgi:cell division septal protein FtsQ
VSRAQVSGNIISRLPYVESVRVGIFLPDTVNIEIKELDVVYAVEDDQGSWWLMNEEGKLVEQINTVASKEYTRILGVRLTGAEVGKMAVAEETVMATIPVAGADQTTDETSETTETTEPTEPEVTIRVGDTGAERLSTALAVIQQLSSNSISGQVDSVDVTNLTDIELWYDERFQINLGNTSQLEYKVGALKATINRMESYESGYLDLTFTNWQDKVGYTPFT